MNDFELKLKSLIDEECKRSGLAAVLDNVEPGNIDLHKTLLGIYDSLAYIRQKYFLNPEIKEDGMLVITNISPVKTDEETPLISITGIHGLEPKLPDGIYSFHNETGKKKLEELIYDNGLVLAEAKTGVITAYAGYLYIGMVPGAIAKRHGMNFSWKELGIKEAERKKLGGPTYTGVGMRHLSALSASGLDPDLYAFVLSREAYGTITLFHDFQILFSTIEDEINKKYKPIYEAAKRESEKSCHGSLSKFNS